MLPLKISISRSLPNAVQPAVILLCLCNYVSPCLVFCSLSLSQLDVTIKVFYLNGVDIYRLIVFYHHLRLQPVHLHTLFSLSSVSYCTICCSSRGL